MRGNTRVGFSFFHTFRRYTSLFTCLICRLLSTPTSRYYPPYHGLLRELLNKNMFNVS